MHNIFALSRICYNENVWHQLLYMNAEYAQTKSQKNVLLNEQNSKSTIG